MYRSIAVSSTLACVALALTLAASASWAGTEELAPATAQQEVAQSSGVVLVDLFAHW